MREREREAFEEGKSNDQNRGNLISYELWACGTFGFVIPTNGIESIEI
jgi:hypothetical protein